MGELKNIEKLFKDSVKQLDQSSSGFSKQRNWKVILKNVEKKTSDQFYVVRGFLSVATVTLTLVLVFNLSVNEDASDFSIDDYYSIAHIDDSSDEGEEDYDGASTYDEDLVENLL